MNLLNRMKNFHLKKCIERKKMFIVQLKLGNTRDGSRNDRYTIAYYFEKNAATSSFNKDSHISVENQFLQAKEQNSETGSSSHFF